MGKYSNQKAKLVDNFFQAPGQSTYESAQCVKYLITIFAADMMNTLTFNRV